jgi:hypothetical protein
MQELVVSLGWTELAERYDAWAQRQAALTAAREARLPASAVAQHLVVEDDDDGAVADEAELDASESASLEDGAAPTADKPFAGQLFVCTGFRDKAVERLIRRGGGKYIPHLTKAGACRELFKYCSLYSMIVNRSHDYSNVCDRRGRPPEDEQGAGGRGAGAEGVPPG